MAISQKEAFEILGVPLGSDLQTCKRAYHAICKQIHPDNSNPLGLPSGECRDASERILLVNEAYAIVQTMTEEDRKTLQNVTNIPKTSNTVSYDRKPKVFGSPVPVKQSYKKREEQSALQAKLLKQKRYEELKEKSRQLEQQEKEAKILDQIRWIRVSELVRQSMEEDARREELMSKAKEAIRKAREE